MISQRIHLVRHGEVFNPDGVLYGRLPGFGLSERGHRMAKLAADDLAERQVPATRLVVSPLQRTRESAQPIADALGLEMIIDERVVEPWNEFEGKQLRGKKSALRHPSNWHLVTRPWVPSWGEPFVEIAARMREALLEHAMDSKTQARKSASASIDGGQSLPAADVIVVSHQLPIWMVHRAVTHQPLPHNPAKRRCSLSSITALEYHPATGFTEAAYREPALTELASATDQGAV
ncbi:histidine phosphatase family protein [Gulosibacter molinativorax]|uniref:Histidine phosphatase family protein n=1 Tax=Gulosibacter molinativorax TaxID=256821 RepID=A0ABT7CAS6_9MICO|nr:histidine phosphatase family protein [Gulosibacter molinativorax]MDJ1372307.1 histidine phosphatase family protein [Gulosibacter molinativorax]QUY63401.1 Phosphoglycerate mutase [Gulosibacter molinativorax]